MSSEYIKALTQQMYEAHGAFSDMVTVYQAARSKHVGTDALSQITLNYLAAGERLDQTISTLLHHLHGLLRSDVSDAAAEQAQEFRNVLHRELNLLGREQA
jgi:hypothetical protein